MTPLRIYNTLTREKALFTPLISGKVRMYVCGMTVYDYCHLGHARVMVVFDLVKRWLCTLGYHVIYVRNITDIDDKIIARARENGESIAALTERFIRAMHADSAALGVGRPDIEPRATAFIPQMCSMIAQLEKNGYAYQAADGDMYYAVHRFSSYGRLSGKILADLQAGARVAVNEVKQDPLDFVLWKRTKPDEPADASWDTAWGRGRPGWHIECSAMSSALLGERFDIHGGGQDLQFPHHENEIAQSEAAHQQTFVNYWMHNGYVQIDDEKMSKSRGNFLTVREVLADFDAEVIRFFIVRAHYRSPLHYSHALLDDARAALTRLYTALKETPPDSEPLDWNEAHAQQFHDAMNDDFNTPLALSVLFELVGQVNKTRNTQLARQLKQLAGTLGLLARPPQQFFQHSPNASLPSLSCDAINRQITAREQARQAGDYRAADHIRAGLLAQGIVLEDRPDGLTEWRRA
jgi:cysteinyl-tRNA synthetase